MSLILGAKIESVTECGKRNSSPVVPLSDASGRKDAWRRVIVVSDSLFRFAPLLTHRGFRATKRKTPSYADLFGRPNQIEGNL